METEQTAVEQSKEKVFTGWLAFFLGVYLGLGSWVSLLFNVIINIGEKNGPLTLIICLILNGIAMFVAIAAIRAFCLYKSNAVSLAKTYIIIRVMDIFMVMSVACMLGNSPDYSQEIGAFIACVVWYVYLHVSKQVKRIIPVETRTWKRLEKCLLTIYAVIVLVFVSLCGLALLVAMKTAEDVPVEEMPIEQPAIIHNDMVFEDVVEEDGVTIYQFKCNSLLRAELTQQDLVELAQQAKQDRLHELLTNVEASATTITALNGGYTVTYQYYDRNAQLLYEVTITPDEYDALTNQSAPLF